MPRPRPTDPRQRALGRTLPAAFAVGHAQKIAATLTIRSKSNLPVFEEVSAGGLVIAPFGGVAYVAVIARRNRNGQIEWCLPKGHLEADETPVQAAVREVREETGIRGTVIQQLALIDYWFDGTGKRIHKYVHHFLMEALTFDLSVEGDPDQEADDAQWVKLSEVGEILAYPNERDVVKIAQNLLQVGR